MKYMKKLTSVLAAGLLCVLTVLPVFASANPTRVLDYADLMTDSEEARLDAVLETVSERLTLDLVVLTSDDLGGKDSKLYAADIYDNYDGTLPDRYGYGDTYDGLIMFVDYENREVVIVGTGEGENYSRANSPELEYILDEMWDNVLSGEFAAAGEDFAYAVEYLVRYGLPKYEDPDIIFDPDDYYENGIEIFGISTPYTSSDIFGKAVLSVIVGLIIGFIVTGVMRGKMKTVRFESGASNYMNRDSLVLTEQSDTFLYSNVTRIAKPKDNSNNNNNSSNSFSGGSIGGGSFHGSSGTHHSGGGRSF